ncbi:pyridoxal-phosphate dependent enzyme [Corallococcus aberystwythensis]|uniref:Pyridoxal-phosphate dependent enzyme n=1 Tax=Corallococcus aberystwythensis TaxID=2316722 RepID=A0A3A8QWP1_9BACT|nr:pyridoxal-phosphate dependent enzyme [Corallococcus aberystwythensis]RKH73199.1 pyridoxal-phosphate dependent enzyme [Corallococcus aberystwythensis]
MRGVFSLSRPRAGGPVVLWGGAQPSGSLKYLTFARYLAAMPPGSRGLVELSGASSALALEVLGRERGLPTVALTDAAGEVYLRDHGFQGEVRKSDSMADLFMQAQALERDGWSWPRQLTNRAMVSCVEAWASGLRAQVRERFPTVRHVVCGFGTGATLVGLTRIFMAGGYTVTGLQPASGKPVPGWRTWAAQNLGAEDLFFEHQPRMLLATAAPAPDAFAALMDYARRQPHPERILIIAHNAREPDSARAA